MADRVLNQYQEPEQGSWKHALEVQRSSAGQPGLLFTAQRWQSPMHVEEITISVPDGDEFLAPVLEWLGRSRTANEDTVPSLDTVKMYAVYGRVSGHFKELVTEDEVAELKDYYDLIEVQVPYNYTSN